MRDLFKNRNPEFFVGYSTISFVWPMIILLGNLSLARAFFVFWVGDCLSQARATPSVNSSYFDNKQSHPLCLSFQIMVIRWRAVLSYLCRSLIFFSARKCDKGACTLLLVYSNGYFALIYASYMRTLFALSLDIQLQVASSRTCDMELVICSDTCTFQTLLFQLVWVVFSILEMYNSYMLSKMFISYSVLALCCEIKCFLCCCSCSWRPLRGLSAIEGFRWCS